MEYCDAHVVLPRPVKKHIWNGEQFIPMSLYRINSVLSLAVLQWLHAKFEFFGTQKSGNYWDYSDSGNFTVMDKKVYTWYQIKWG